MNIHGKLFRDEELTLILLSHALETWQKSLYNPWAQFISLGELWPHQVSGLSPSYLLDLGEVVLGRNLFRDYEDTMYPHLDSAHRFLGLLSEMHGTELSATNTYVLWPWQMAVSGQKGGLGVCPRTRLALLISPCTGGKSIRDLPTFFLMP